TGADLSAVNLFKGSLRKAKVERAVMHHANLYGVDVEEVKISRAALEGADTGQTLLQVRPPT
ncbi:pentapeptide repeat-containing protein, partial [Salmonella enterica]